MRRFVCVLVVVVVTQLCFPESNKGECTVTITSDPPSATVCAGNVVTLTANVSGGITPYAYLWSNGATSQVITVTISGTYSVTVTDMATPTPCNATNQIVVTVNALPDPVITGSDFGCAGTIGNIYSTPLNTGSTFLWTVVGGTFTGQGSNQIAVTWGVSGTGMVKVKETDNTTSCFKEVTKSVIINAPPTPLVTGSNCVCVNLSNVAYSTPSHSGSTYSWIVTGGNFLPGAGPNSVLVNWGPTAMAGSVQVIETQNGCSTANTLNVTITNTYPSTNFSISNNGACSGTNVNFAGPSTPGLTYLWNFGDPASGSANSSTLQNPSHVYRSYGCGTTDYAVTLTITSPCGCTATSSGQNLTIKRQPKPRLADIDINSPFSNCDNNPTPANPVFDLTVNNITTNTSCITGYTINWGDGVTEPYPAGFATANHTYNQLGAFDLKITAFSSNGCSSDTTYLVANQSNPAVGIAAPGTTSGCYPITWPFTISGAALNSPGTIYRIEFGDGTVLTKTNDQLLGDSIIPHTYTNTSCGQPGNMFIVKVTAKNGCDSTYALVSNVRVYKPPVAHFTPNPDSIGCTTNQFCFINETQTGFGFNCTPATSYSWNFGDPASGVNNTSTTANPCHTFSSPGTYIVSLTASNGPCPNSSTFTHSVCVDPSPNSSFNVDKTTSCVPFTVTAINTSTTPNTCGDRVFAWTVTKNGSPQCLPSAQNFTLTPVGNDATIVFQDPGEYTITLTVKNACNPAGVISTKTITAKSPPRVTLASITDMCQNGTVTPTATYQSCYDPITEYLWTFSGGSPATSGNANPSGIAYNTSGIYTIKVKAKNICGWSNETTSNSFQVKPLPTVNAGLPQTICKGGNTVLNGQVGGSATGGTWSSSAGGTFSNPNTLNATWTPPAGYSGNATLTLTTTGMNPCSAISSTVNIVVLATPTSNAGTSQTICQGGSATLTGSVGGSATGGTWSTTAGGTFNPNANDLHATWTPLPGFFGTATLVLTTTGMNPCNAVTSSVSIIVRPTPTVSAGTAPTVCQLGVVALNGSVGGSATGGTWSSGSGGTFSPNANTLNASWTPPTGFNGTAVLTLTTTGMAPCPAVSSQLNVVIAPTPTANAGTSQTICQGSTASLNGTIGGSATGGSWSTSSGGIFLPNSNDLHATWTPLIGFAGVATLTLTTTGMAPCPAVSSNVNITVRATPTVNAGTAQIICQGGSAVLIGTIGGAATGGTWSTTAGGSFSPNASTLSATWTPPSTFSGSAVLTLTTTGMSPCTELSSPVTITVKPTPIVNAGADQTICQGGSIQLNGSIGGAATGATWTTTAGGTFTPSPSTLNATWAPPVGFSGNAVINLTSTGMSPCNAVTSSVNITVRPTPIVSAGTPLTICQGGSVNLAGTVGGSASGGTWHTPSGGTFTPNQNTLNAIWTPPPAFTGSAVLTLTTTGMAPCAAVFSTVNITVNPVQAISTQPTSNQSLCIGGMIPNPLAITFTGGTGNPSYQWYSNSTPLNTGGTLITGATTANYTPLIFTSAGTYYYYAVVTLSGAGCGNTTSNIATVEVVADPILTAQPLATQTLCQSAPPADLTLTATGGTGTFSYQWFVNTNPINSGGTSISGATNSNFTPPTAVVGTKHYYCVVNQTGPGCSVTSSVATVVVNEGPSFTTQPVASTVCLGVLPSILTMSYSNGAGVPVYQWYSNSINNIAGSIAIPGATNTSYQPTSTTVGTTYFYGVISLGSGGCANITSEIVPVVVKPIPGITSSPIDSICSNNPFNYLITSNVAGSSFTWHRPAVTGIANPVGNGNSEQINETLINNTGSDIDVVYQIQVTGPGLPPCHGDQFNLTVKVKDFTVDAGSDVTIAFGTRAFLHGLVTGGGSNMHYSWTPGTMILNGPNTLDPETQKIYISPYTFNLTVNDLDMEGCTLEDDVDVILVGSAVAVQPTIDPTPVCPGGLAQLTANPSGGSGNYTFSWTSNPPGNPVWTSTLENPSVNPLLPTTYTVILNDGFNTVSGSVTAATKTPPEVFSINGGGQYCAGGSGVTIGMAGTSLSDTYRLKDPDGAVITAIGGTGTALTFGIYTATGNYTAEAISISTPQCISSMNDVATVAIIPLPIPYCVTGGGSYSAGGSGVPVGLSNSQVGVEYELILNGDTPLLPRVQGNGFPITFGSQIAAGIYTVKAYTLTNPLCTEDMICSAEVIINPWPSIYSVYGGGPLCLGDGGVTIGLNGSEIGVLYEIRNNGNVVGSLPGTGDSLDFGLFNQSGFYTVKGTTVLTGLSKMMDSSATITVNPLPLPYLMVPQGDTCYGTEVLLNGSQAGINYYLLKRNDTIAVRPGTGVFGLLTFGHIYDTGEFHAIAINPLTGCMNNMIGTVNLLPAPEIFQLLPPGILCPGQEIWLTGSQTGILYQLRRDSLINVGPPIPGTGDPLNFGPQFLPGKYRVIAYSPLTHCYSWMDLDATIQPPPVVYNILPSGDTCAGALVRLNGSQTGISYRLILNHTVYLDSLYGTGLPLVFGTYTTAGIYTITAIDTLTHCEYEMADSMVIHPSPLAFNVLPNGIACVNMVVGLDGSEPGAQYTLIRDGIFTAAGPVTGTGNPISFGAQTMPGIYTVEAVSDDYSCTAFMTGAAEFNLRPTIFQIEPQGPECAGSPVYLNGSQTGVFYELLRDSFVQSVKTGTGGMIDFGMQHIPGVYTVRAVFTETLCDTLMGGTVTILAGPVDFPMTMNGILCPPAEIGIAGSEIGILYQLRRDSIINVGAPLPGTGYAITFGEMTLPGDYRVLAQDPASGCHSWMSGKSTLQPPAMVFNILPSGDSCAPAVIRLNGSQPDKWYRLNRNGITLPDSLRGTGQPIVFGSYFTSGVYHIEAYDTASRCTYLMADSLRILDLPTPFNVVPNGISCVGMAVGLDDSEPGINYFLIRDNTSLVAGPVPGTGSAITFGNQPYAGSYTVEAIIGTSECHAWMNGYASLWPKPVSYLLQPQGLVCAGTNLYLNGSDQQVNYQLLRDNQIVVTLPGTGTLLHFGAQYLEGIYTVKAVYIGSTCDTLMTGSAVIVPRPLDFDVTPAGANCSPAMVGLSGSQQGIFYQLYRDGFAQGDPVPGTGTPISFGLQSAGNYQVIATATTPIVCADTMSGIAVITNGPEAFAGNDTSVCASHSLQLMATATDYSTVIWKTEGDGIFNDPLLLHPVYTPGPADIQAGGVQLSLKIFGTPACLYASDADTLQLAIDPFPVVAAGTDDTICLTGAASLNATAQHFSTCQWFTSGDGHFDNPITLNPVYTPGPQDKQQGEVILRLKVFGTLACSPDTTSDLMRLVIIPLPDANAGVDDTICENWSYRLTGQASNHSSLLWTSLGDGAFINPSIPDAEYNPGPNDRMTGMVRLVMTANGRGQCHSENDRDTVILMLIKLPIVDVGRDTTLCSNQSYTNNALVQWHSGMEWTTSGDGTFNNRFIPDAVYSPGPLDILTESVWLKLSALGLQKCSAETVSDSLLLALHPMPVAMAGSDSITCPNIPSPLHGSATHYTSVLWNTLGDGLFTSNSIMDTWYTPGVNDVLAGYVDLTLTVNGEAQCSPMIDTDTVRLTFKPLPTITLEGTDTICEGNTGSILANLTGVPPWSFTYSDGVSTHTVSNIPASPFELTVDPIVTTTYTIISVSDGNCTVNATGPAFTIMVQPQPDTYTMTVTHGGAYCDGGSGVEIGIDGSQPGIFYQLFFGGQPSGFPMPGNGHPISFGLKTQPGVYQVKAVHPQTLCDVFFSDSIVVVVFGTPRVDFSSDSACVGQYTQFSLHGLDIGKIAVWEWDFGDGTTASYTAPVEPQHLFPAVGNYLVTLQVMDTNTCTKSVTHPVTVYELPVALFSHTTPVCSGYEVTFNDYSYAPGNNYLIEWHWDFGDGNDTTVLFPDFPDVNHIYSFPGPYLVTLTVTNNRGCTELKTRTVQITPSPVANFDYSNVCKDENVYFNDISQLQGGGSIVGWQWNFGDPLSGVNNTSIQSSPIHVYQSTGNFQVRLVVMNSGGCIDTIVKSLAVNESPEANFVFDTACHGSVTHFTDISTPHAANNIEWDWDFGDGSPHSTSQNPDHQYANPGTYAVKLTVINSNYCSHDTTIQVTVLPLPVAGFETNSPVCTGAPVTFISTSTTLHGYIVQWTWDFGDGTPPVVRTFPQSPHVTHSFSGTGTQYLVRLTVKTSDSCSSSVEHPVTTIPKPVANFGHSTVLCPGQDVQFTDLSQTNGGYPITGWFWDFGDPNSGIFNTSSIQHPSHSFTAGGTYNVKLIVSNGNNCRDTTAIPVIISQQPTAAFIFDTVCLGTPTQFEDQSQANTGSIIAWDWDFGDGTQHASTPDPAHLYLTPGVKTVTLTVTNSNQCQKSVTRTVLVRPKPVALFAAENGQCAGTPVSFTDYSTASQGYIVRWTWNFGDGNTATINFPAPQYVLHTYATGGSYLVTLTVKTSDSCEASVSNTISVTSSPMANFSNGNSPCELTPVQFTDLTQTNGGGALLSWNWVFDDPSTGINNVSNLPNPLHAFSAAGTYDVRLIVMNINQCSDTIIKQVAVGDNPQAKFSADTACKGTLTHFTDNSLTIGGTIISWIWDFGDGTPVQSGQNQTHLYTSSGIFNVTLTVQTSAGCQNDTTQGIVVKTIPNAEFMTTGTCAEAMTQFTDLSTTASGVITGWEWQFGDGTTSTLQNPQHMYAQGGSYLVKLKVTNSGSCTDSVAYNISIHQRPTAAFSYFSKNCPKGEVVFTDLTLPMGSPITNWYWYPEPNIQLTNQNPVYLYTSTGINQLIRMIVKDAHGCMDTIDSTIFIKPGFAFTFNATQACLGVPTQFEPVNLAAGDTLKNLFWSFGEPTQPNNTSTLYSPVHTYSSPSTFTVKLKAWNADNCSDSVFREVTVHMLPTLDIGWDEGVHCDKRVIFTQNSAGNGAAMDSLLFRFGDNTTATLYPPFPDTIGHSYTDYGYYDASATVYNHRGCSLTDSLAVTVACVTASFINKDTVACQHSKTTLLDQSSPSTMISSWYWSFGDGSDTTYLIRTGEIRHTWTSPGNKTIMLVVTTMANGVAVRDTSRINLMVRHSPVSAFSVASVCAGDSSVFINLSDSNGTRIIATKWKFNDGSSIIDTSSLLDPVYRYLTTGKHNARLIQVNELGCTDTVVNTARVFKLPDARFTPPSACARNQVVFRDQSVKGDTLLARWFWDFNNPLRPDELIEGKDVTYRYERPGNYTVKLRAIDHNGCEDSVMHPVELKPSPLAAFTITPDYQGKPGQVRMNNKSSDSVVAWQWWFEAGKGSTEKNPVHLYSNDGKYNISLVVKSINGCYDTTYLAYEFLFDHLFVPNALAPDNLSDAIDCRVFRPKGMNLRDYHVMIFNKWGHLLWESKLITDDDKRMPAEGWDGTHKGEPMPQDVYVWKISATFENGKVWEGTDQGSGTVSTMGTVTLIR